MEQTILTHFRIPGTFVQAEQYGSGLIHDTWLCEFKNGDGRRKYILQRMNASVFKRPEQVMENIQVVTTHIMDKVRAHGLRDPEHHTLTLVPAWSGHPYFLDSTARYWRVFHFIESCAVYSVIADPALAFEMGHGLGRFHALVSDLAPRRLNETLPGFHHPERYFKSFEETVKEDN